MRLLSRAARPRDEGRPARELGQAGGPDPSPRAAGPGGPVPLARGGPASGRPSRRAGARPPAGGGPGGWPGAGLQACQLRAGTRDRTLRVGL